MEPLVSFFLAFTARAKPEVDFNVTENEENDSGIEVTEFQNLMECMNHNSSSKSHNRFERLNYLESLYI